MQGKQASPVTRRGGGRGGLLILMRGRVGVREEGGGVFTASVRVLDMLCQKLLLLLLSTTVSVYMYVCV